MYLYTYCIYTFINFRTAVAATLTKELGIRHAKKTIEKLGAIFEDYGDMLGQALKSFWEAMVINKICLDFFIKLRLCFGGIMQISDAKIEAAALALFLKGELLREKQERAGMSGAEAEFPPLPMMDYGRPAEGEECGGQDNEVPEGGEGEEEKSVVEEDAGEYMYIYIYTCIYMYIYTYILYVYVFIYMFICIHKFIYVPTYIHKYLYICKCICIFTYIYIYIYIHIYIYIYIYIYMYITHHAFNIF
jgi:hypothetical protein